MWVWVNDGKQGCLKVENVLLGKNHAFFKQCHNSFFDIPINSVCVHFFEVDVRKGYIALRPD